MDMVFEKVRDLMPMVNVNISAANKHVVEVERRIQTIKAKFRGVLGMLPFTCHNN